MNHRLLLLFFLTKTKTYMLFSKHGEKLDALKRLKIKLYRIFPKYCQTTLNIFNLITKAHLVFHKNSLRCAEAVLSCRPEGKAGRYINYEHTEMSHFLKANSKKKCELNKLLYEFYCFLQELVKLEIHSVLLGMHMLFYHFLLLLLSFMLDACSPIRPSW